MNYKTFRKALPKNYVPTWFSPLIEVTIHAPRPCVQLTLIPPISEHTAIYHNIVFFPYLGAIKNMIINAVVIHAPPYARNQGARNNFRKATMVVTDCSWGPLRAIMIAPRMHCTQPIQPKPVYLLRHYSNWLPAVTKPLGEPGRGLFTPPRADSGETQRLGTSTDCTMRATT